jgi:hypothetical protein
VRVGRRAGELGRTHHGRGRSCDRKSRGSAALSGRLHYSASSSRSSGRRDLLQIYLERGLVARVAALAFGLDLARMTVLPLDGLDLPQLTATKCAVDAELTGDGAGGSLAA